MVSIHKTLLALAVAVAVAAAFAPMAHGGSYTVGEPGGSWDLQTNYTAWASSVSFRLGDQLGNYLTNQQSPVATRLGRPSKRRR
jgi:hypothetical protein